jgi:DNA-binding CsgD family transcriptional regulator
VSAIPPVPDPSALEVLGFTAAQERVYRRVLRSPGESVTGLADLAGLPVAEVRGHLRRLAVDGLVELRGETVVARPPHQALKRLLAEETRRWQSRADRLDAVRAEVLPSLTAEHLTASLPDAQPVGVELYDGADVTLLLDALGAVSTGDLRWMRPGPWDVPVAPQVDAWVRDAVRGGRRSRVLYPARILEQAPEVIWARADVGEHVRILADVPCRLAVLGDGAALVSEEHGVASDRRLVIRQASLVAAPTLLFDTLWEKAMPVPGVVGHRKQRDELAQRLLLDLLADGAKDEQIARELGISLRTVRRRVAELNDELGADSRFQAGVEAVRRGWV